MKYSALGLIVFCLISCGNTAKKKIEKKQEKENVYNLNLNDTLLIGKDFTISSLKIDSLTYSDFKNQHKVAFTETKNGSLSCGNSSPMWSSGTSLKNNALGIELNFNKSWVENTPEPKEQVLTLITLDNAKAKFYNGLILGKSRITEVKQKFGKPAYENNYVVQYNSNKVSISLIYNEPGIVYYISFSRINQIPIPQDSLALNE